MSSEDSIQVNSSNVFQSYIFYTKERLLFNLHFEDSFDLPREKSKFDII